MLGPALTRSLWIIGVVACVGAGCGQLDTLLDAVQRHKGGTTSPPSAQAGTSGSSTGAGGSSGGSATGNDPMCVEITEGGPGTCTDYATYKIRSSDVCAQENLFISNLKPGPMCGNGGVESMTFVCCPPPAPSPVTCSEGTDANGRVCKTCVDASGKVVSSDCNANVPGMMCVKIPDGGSTSCKPYDLWKQYGTSACAQQKMQLTELVVGTPCGSNYQDVTYVCCATIPSGSTGAGGSSGTPPPLPPKCGQTTDASGQLCKTCWDPVTGKEISNDCAPGSTGSGGSGGGGQAGQMPPNEICDVKTNADGSQCKTCYYSDGTTASSCASP